MRLLLDTHVLLWWLDDRPALKPSGRALISDSMNEVYVSAISAAEIGIKSSLGKLRTPENLEEQLEADGFSALPLRIRHGLAVKALPRHHGDPFDRLLIAQAQCEDLPILTADPAFESYDVRTIDAAA